MPPLFCVAAAAAIVAFWRTVLLARGGGGGVILFFERGVFGAEFSGGAIAVLGAGERDLRVLKVKKSEKMALGRIFLLAFA